MNEIFRLIDTAVKVNPKCAVYISGGVDSTIVLHHLSEKSNEKIHTYSAKFGVESDESEKAKKIDKHYNTIHKTIEVTNFVDMLEKTMKFFKLPRYNIWPYYLAQEAKKDGIEYVYIGEGGDEHFGGYPDRGFLEAWANQLVLINETYVEIHNHLDLKLEKPFYLLDYRDTLKYYKPPKKELLIEAYKGLLPKEVVSSPPAFSHESNYTRLWNKEVKKFFPEYEPGCLQDIRNKFQELATLFWIRNKEQK